MAEPKTFTEVAESVVGQLSDEQPEFSLIQSRLFKLIDYAKDRYHWYEEQREKRLSLATFTLALAGSALAVLSSSAKTGGIDQSSAIFFLSALTLFFTLSTALVVVLVYLRGQNIRYTHRRNLASTPSWYGYKIPKDISISAFEQLIWGEYATLIDNNMSDQEILAKRKRLSESFEQFSESVLGGLVSTHKSMKEDLQQIFILQIFQNIARQNLRLMTSVLKVGVWFTSISALSLAILVLFFGIPLSQTGAVP